MEDLVHPIVAEEIRELSDKRLHSAVVELEAWSRRMEWVRSSLIEGRHHYVTTTQIMGACIVEESMRVCASEP